MLSTITATRKLYRPQILYVNEFAINLPTRLQIVLWGLLVLISVTLSLRGFQLYQVGAHYDDARYVMLAHSLLSAEDYGMIHEPGLPKAPFYPFGFPLLLAPFVALFPKNFDALRAVSLFATVINSALLFWGWHYFSQRSYWWAIAVTGLYALGPLTIDFSRQIMSEPVFTLCCLLSLLLAERAVRGQQDALWYLWMSLALTFTLFTRTIGIVLLFSIFCYLLLRKGRRFWKDMLLLGVGMMTIVSLIVAVTVIGPSDLWPSEYLNQKNAVFLQHFRLDRLLSQPKEVAPANPIPENLPAEDRTGGNTDSTQPTLKTLATSFFLAGFRWHIEEHYRKIIVPIGGDEYSKEQAIANRLGFPALPIMIGYLIFGLFVLGCLRWMVQEGLSAFSLFAIFYMGALLIWPWNEIRFLYPVQPQLQFGFLLGVEAILLALIFVGKSRMVSYKVLKWLLVTLVLTLLAISIVKSIMIEDSRMHIGDVEVRTAWLKVHTDPSVILMTDAPEVDFLHSQRKAIPYPLTLLPAPGDLEAYLQQNKVGYILVAPEIVWQRHYQPSYSQATDALLPLLTALEMTSRLQRVYSSENRVIQVFKYELQE